MLAQRKRRSAHDEVIERGHLQAEIAVLLLEGAAKINHGIHRDLEAMRELGHLGQALHHASRNRSAHALHRDDRSGLLHGGDSARLGRRCWRGNHLATDGITDILASHEASVGLHGIDVDTCLSGIATRQRRGDLRRACGSSCFNILGDDATVGAGASNLRDIDAELIGHAASVGRHELATTFMHDSGRGSSCSDGARLVDYYCGSNRGCACRSRLARREQPAENCARRKRGAVGHCTSHDAVGLGLDIDIDLVGGKTKQWGADSDDVAIIDEPLLEGALLHGEAELGKRYLNSHD